MGGVQVARPAPDFRGTAVTDRQLREVSLADYRGTWLVLLFYPLDFTSVAPTEVAAFSDRLDAFREAGAEVVGASVDSPYSHLAWVGTPRTRGGPGAVRFPLLADLTKQVSRDWGVLDEESGTALPALFLVDPDGRVAYQAVHDLGVGRSVDETLRVLHALRAVRETGEVCPAGWAPGDDTIKADPMGFRPR